MIHLIWNLSFLISLFLSLPSLNYNLQKKTKQESNVQETVDYEKIGSDFVAKYNERKGLKKYDFHSKLELKQSFDTILNDFQASYYGIKLNTDENYQEVIDSIAVKREELKAVYENSSYKNIVLDSVRNYFIETFLNHIIPHWYGTKWTMSGNTQIPQKGSVGCSYFVANTLFAMGFDFNRTAVAQSSSRNIARTFQLSQDVVLLKSYKSKEVVNYIKDNYKEGLFIVGLDYHCAFILYYKNEVFLIHSSRTRNKVAIEFAALSKSFISNNYYIGEITTNDNLMIKWLHNEYIPKIEIFEFGKPAS